MSQVYGYDFTISADKAPPLERLKCWLSRHFKSWSFQLEEGEGGFRHFQGRGSLIVKKRLNEMTKMDRGFVFEGGDLQFPVHWSITSKKNINNTDYVTKEATRVEGPWKHDDVSDYVPRQIREVKELYLWQEQIKQQVGVWDKRNINVLYCPGGNIGKSTLIGYLRAYKLARCLPPVNDYKDFMRMVCDLPTARCYCIDMPRAMNKDRLHGFYTGIECLKDGYAYDDRYRFREKYIDCPNIWIFTNQLPDETLCSADRWRLWEVDKEHKILKPYEPPIDDLDKCLIEEF